MLARDLGQVLRDLDADEWAERGQATEEHLTAARFLAEVLAHAPCPWAQDAACKGVDVAVFFPDRGDDYRPALELCDRCEVLEECAAWAATLPPPEHGILAAQTARVRRAARLRSAA